MQTPHAAKAGTTTITVGFLHTTYGRLRVEDGLVTASGPRGDVMRKLLDAYRATGETDAQVALALPTRLRNWFWAKTEKEK